MHKPNLPAGIPKPYAKVVPRQAQHPSVLYCEITQNDIQMSNTQETDNEIVQNPVRQAEHPAIVFRKMTTAQKNKVELKRKLSSIKNQIKELGHQINDEIKNAIETV